MCYLTISFNYKLHVVFYEVGTEGNSCSVLVHGHVEMLPLLSFTKVTELFRLLQIIKHLPFVHTLTLFISHYFAGLPTLWLNKSRKSLREKLFFEKTECPNFLLWWTTFIGHNKHKRTKFIPQTLLFLCVQYIDIFKCSSGNVVTIFKKLEVDKWQTVYLHMPFWGYVSQE